MATSQTLFGLTFAVLLGVSTVTHGQESGVFEDRVLKDADGTEAKYVVFKPAGAGKVVEGKKIPLILFLHGSGETGTDGKKQATVGLGPVVKKEAATFPAYVVFAQSHKRNWRAGSTDANRALRMVDELCKEAPIDTNRIYLTGLSMGGYGTWSLAAAEPKRWAAIVPVCGGGNPADVAKFKDIPCWCFHGDKDTAVKVEKSREMIEALKKVESEPKYTEYPGVGHNSWDKAYGTPELFPWLFAQKRTELK